MNCLEFRRKLLEDPHLMDKDFLEHAGQCEPCARDREKSVQFEDALFQAMTVEAPEGLAERILLARDMEEQRSPRWVSTHWMSVAASLFLMLSVAAWLGFNVGGKPAFAEGLPETVLAHIDAEQEFLLLEQGVAEEKLASLFSNFGAVMTRGIGEVTYAGPCWIRKQAGLHLVLSGEQGPVTVLLMPGEHVKNNQAVSSGRFSGLIVPTTYGSMAVVGEKGEMIDRTVRRLSHAVMWGA